MPNSPIHASVNKKREQGALSLYLFPLYVRLWHVCRASGLFANVGEYAAVDVKNVSVYEVRSV